MTVCEDNIPDELRDRDQWICWRTECRECSKRLRPTTKECPHCGEKATKKPINPHTGGLASSTDSDTWGSLSTAREYDDGNDNTDGVGFVFAQDGVIAGVDLDGCRDPDSGAIDEWAKSVVDDLDSFTEVSPSGTGLHIYVFGIVPDGGNRKDGIEMYDSGRFFTVTGDHLSETPDTIEQRADALKAVHSEHVASDDGDSGGKDLDEFDAPDPDGSTEFANEFGTTLETIRGRDDKLDQLLSHIEPGYSLPKDDNSPSGYDMATASRLWFWRFDERQISQILRTYRPRDKMQRNDYVTRTIKNAKGGDRCDKPQADGGAVTAQTNEETTSGEDSIPAKFGKACLYYDIDPDAVKSERRNGQDVVVGVREVVPDTTVGKAVMAFNRNADFLDGTDTQAVVGRVVLLDLRDRGEFFQTADDRLFYFYDPESEVYRVDGSGNRILSEDFQGMVYERYNIFSGRFSRNLGRDVKSQAKRDAPTKDVYRFAHYDETAGELYVSDFGSGYYAISRNGIEWLPNGTDVYFLSDDMADSYTYLEPDERPQLPNEIPGERPLWQGGGDPLMRMFGNRVNYDEYATLGPTQQRKQLYIHLHTLPFIDLLSARPIMAWVGEKGSGKTVIQRSIGRFIYGGDYSESIMPDGKEDFLAKVTNQALAFVDNYDDGVDWANDVLAAIATGARLDKRRLYTTNSLQREVPRCWLSITSRDPPFRRDDVADRTLVFRVERVEDGFVGMGDFLHQVRQYRDLLWSTYLDNLQAVVEEYQQRDTGVMSSSHRMADWAIFARITSDALGVEKVDELLETMQAERAAFTLENEPWAEVIDDWVRDDPDDAAQWRKASELLERLQEVSEGQNRNFSIGHAPVLGSKLSRYANELGELHQLEIDDTGRTNKYRFDVGESTPAGLSRY